MRQLAKPSQHDFPTTLLICLLAGPVACKPSSGAKSLEPTTFKQNSVPVQPETATSPGAVTPQSSSQQPLGIPASTGPKMCYSATGQVLPSQMQSPPPTTPTYDSCYNENGVLVYQGTKTQLSCYDELVAQVGTNYDNIVFKNFPSLYQQAMQMQGQGQVFLQNELKSGTCAQLRQKYP